MGRDLWPGRYVTVWDGESPGVKVRVWRPWWRRESRPFASLREMTDKRHPVVYVSGLPWLPIRDAGSGTP